MSKLANYVQGSIQEMKKVTWPTRKETQNYTLLVVGISLAVAAFLGILDFLFTYILEFVIQ